MATSIGQPMIAAQLWTILWKRLRSKDEHASEPRFPACFVGSDLGLALQRHPDLIEAFEQTGASKGFSIKAGQKTFAARDFALVQVHGQMKVTGLVAGFQSRDLRRAKSNSQQSVLDAVVREDVGERWCDDHAESVIAQRPNGVLPRRPA